MSILITQSSDGLFTVVVGDLKDPPGALLPAVKHHCRLRSIKALLIASDFHSAAWRRALATIGHYVIQGMKVQHYDTAGSTVIAAAVPPPGGTSIINSISTTAPIAQPASPVTTTVQTMATPLTFATPLSFALFQTQTTDLQQAQTIYTQVSANAQKQQMQQWKILQDTQTTIFQIQQDVTVNKAIAQDKAFETWDAYIRGR